MHTVSLGNEHAFRTSRPQLQHVLTLGVGRGTSVASVCQLGRLRTRELRRVVCSRTLTTKGQQGTTSQVLLCSLSCTNGALNRFPSLA
jgi:hypothetical protein